MSLTVLDRLCVIHLFISWTEGEKLLPRAPTCPRFVGILLRRHSHDLLPRKTAQWADIMGMAELVLWKLSNSWHKGSGQETFYIL